MHRFVTLVVIVAVSLTALSSCVTEDTYDNTPSGNLEALWHTLDEHYCFFSYKEQESGLRWDSVHEAYRAKLSPSMTQVDLFEVCTEMIRELRDGHVNLTSSYNVGRYWDWYERYPANFSDSIQRNYLHTDYYITQGIKYRLLESGIGYVYCPSFDPAFGQGNLSSIFSLLAAAKGLILDVRNNEGGLLTSAQALAECFINDKTLGGYIAHKTGPGHDDISSPRAITLTPAEGVRWQRQVVVLTNRRCFSAANSLVMYLKGLPRVTVMGARTGGGCGMPFSSELPNGWLLRFSACPMYDRNMQLTESGIDPDIAVDMTSADMQRGKDTMIEAAIQLLLSQ